MTRILGLEVLDSRPLHGGDLSEVRLITLPDRQVVVKRGRDVATEARMLRAMARTGAPVPQVLEVGDDVLVLSYLPETTPATDTWRRLGADLARMHGTVGDRYGWDEDHAFGAVRIDNTPNGDWPGFWAERRLLSGIADVPQDLAGRLERLAARLPGLLPKTPPAALLHGDLWAGNLLFTAERGWLIDPACYHGDAEVDLAMLHLFGRPGPGFDEGYGALRPGWQDRRPIYQLWPALVHLRLFGQGYRGMVERCLGAIGA